jgi:hypothetical protein
MHVARLLSATTACVQCYSFSRTALSSIARSSWRQPFPRDRGARHHHPLVARYSSFGEVCPSTTKIGLIPSKSNIYSMDHLCWSVNSNHGRISQKSSSLEYARATGPCTVGRGRSRGSIKSPFNPVAFLFEACTERINFTVSHRLCDVVLPCTARCVQALNIF